MQDPHSRSKKNLAILICAAGSAIGIGHLSRILSLGNTLKHEFQFDVRIIILTHENRISLRNLHEFSPLFMKPIDDVLLQLTSYLNFFIPDAIVIDHHPSISLTPSQLSPFLGRKVCFVGVDPPLELLSQYAINWFPTFYSNVLQSAKAKNYRLDNCYYGWDCFLLYDDEITEKNFNQNPVVLILTGSTNAGNLYQELPEALDRAVIAPCHFRWVVGPFASTPLINQESIHNWEIIQSPPSLLDQYKSANYSIANFGMSAIESMQHGLATIILSHSLHRDIEEMAFLSSENVCLISNTIESAALDLNNLLTKSRMAIKLSNNARNKFSERGAHHLSQKIIANLQSATNCSV